MGLQKTLGLLFVTVLLSSCDLSFLQLNKGQPGPRPVSSKSSYNEASLEEAANAIQNKDGRIDEARLWIKDGGFDSVLKTKNHVVPPFEKTASNREEGSGTFPNLVFGVNNYPNAQNISVLKELLSNSILDTRELVHGTDFLTQLQPVFFVRVIKNRKTLSVPAIVADNEKNPTVDFSKMGSLPYEIESPVGYSKDAEQITKIRSFTEDEPKALQAPFPFTAFVSSAILEQSVGKKIENLSILMSKAIAQPSEKVTGNVTPESYKVEKAGVSYALDLVWNEYEVIQLTLQRQLDLRSTSPEFKKTLAEKASRPGYLDYFNEQKGKTDRFQFRYSKLPNADFGDLAGVETIVKASLSGVEIKLHESDLPRLEKAAFLRTEDGKLLKAVIHLVGEPTVEPRRLQIN